MKATTLGFAKFLPWAFNLATVNTLTVPTVGTSFQLCIFFKITKHSISKQF